MIDLNSIKNCSVSVAFGKQKLPMSRGSFVYKDSLSKKRRAAVTVLSESDSALELEVSCHGESIAVMSAVSSGKEGSNDVRIQLKLLPSFESSYNRFYISFNTSNGEHYYGCGETFSKFDLKGEKVRVWVAEHQNVKRISKKIITWRLFGKHPHRVAPFSKYESYYVQPTFVSSGRWFLHMDTSAYSQFDFTKDGVVGIELRESTSIYISSAESFPALSKKLSACVGTPAFSGETTVLPEWVYDGVILGVQGGPAVLEEKLSRARRHSVPVVAVWSQDWCGCRKTGFGYQVMWNWRADDSLYPDLPSRIAEWRREGVRFLGYINPFIAIEQELYACAKENGYCVKNASGEDYLVTITTFPAAMVDFTNPKAYEWYKDLIKKNMIDIGMSGWMADFGEYLPPDAVLHSGESPLAMHNRWPALWARLNREAVLERGVQNEVFFFTRAGYTQTIRNSMLMWNGDQHVDFSIDDGLASVIPSSLSLGMSGFPLVHSDIGGYTTIMQMIRSRELLCRWTEMNAFSPLMRSHEGNQPIRNVQLYDEDGLLDMLSYFSSVHKCIKNYLRDAERLACAEGVPVMRPLFYHYDEKEAYEESYEYLLGRDVLVAPVLDEKAVSRLVYLPHDEWVHLWTKENFSGGSCIVDAPLGKPPVFVRKSSEWFDEIMSAGATKIRENID